MCTETLGIFLMYRLKSNNRKMSFSLMLCSVFGEQIFYIFSINFKVFVSPNLFHETDNAIKQRAKQISFRMLISTSITLRKCLGGLHYKFYLKKIKILEIIWLLQNGAFLCSQMFFSY